MPKDTLISLDFKGWRELEKNLLDLGNDRTIRATMKRAMLEAAEPMARDARSRAPRGATGNLVESIDVGVKLSRRQAAEKGSSPGKAGNTVEVFVGPGKGGRAGVLFEFGTGPRRTKSGANRGSVQARPFMRPAWEANKHQVLRDFGVQLGREIESSARRIARKRARAAK